MNIVLVSYNRFPNGDAGAVRDYMFGKMLKTNGHNIFYIGMGSSNTYKQLCYEGFNYTSLKLSNANKIQKIKNYINYSKRLKKYLEGYLSIHRIDILWIVSLPLNAVLMLKLFARKNDIKLIHDSVEWYSPEQFKLGRMSPEYIIKNINNRFLINKDFAVVAISKYLETYYKNKNIKTIRIPIVLDKDDIQFVKSINYNKLIILYAGSPGKKDYLYLMLNGLSLLSSEQLNKIEFRIIGVDENQVNKMFTYSKERLDKIRKCLNILGRRQRKDVIENLSQVDYTVLLRSPEQRYAKAGFPTKVVESLATGTPVILNLTSDLADYIIDKENGIIIEECSALSFKNAIIKAYHIKYIEKTLEIMQNNARDTFNRYFDYRLYTDILETIIY